MRYDRETLQAKLRQSPRWRAKALLMLYEAQTPVEQIRAETLEHNERGFGGTDAPRLTAAAKFLQTRGYVTRNIDIMLQRRLPKYWRQLVEAIARRNPQRLIRAGKSFVEIADHG